MSFYNQNPEGPVYPTPTIGMVGVLDDFNNRMTLDFKNAGDVIVLIGTQKNDIGSIKNMSFLFLKILKIEGIASIIFFKRRSRFMSSFQRKIHQIAISASPKML